MEVSDLGRVEQLSVWLEVHPKLNVSLIDHLWNRLHGMYLDKWSRQFPDEVSVANWQESWIAALEAKRIVPAEINEGLNRCAEVHPVFPPTLGEFLAACRPPLPPEASFYEAVRGMAARDNGESFAWSHPAIFWAAAEVGFELRITPYPQIASRWASVLKEVQERGSWGEIVDPPKRVSWVRQVSELGQTAMAEIKEAAVPVQASGDLTWARQIMRRHEAGEKVNFLPLKMARSALGLE